MSLSFEDAKAKAIRFLDDSDPPVTIIENEIREFGGLWLFFYQSSRYLAGDAGALLVGTRPVFVAKDGGLIGYLNYCRPYEESKAAYRYCGDPNGVAIAQVELSDWKIGANKIEAIRKIRRYSIYGLKDAKEAIDRCFRREKTRVVSADVQAASELAKALADLGFVAELIYVANEASSGAASQGGFWQGVSEAHCAVLFSDQKA